MKLSYCVDDKPCKYGDVISKFNYRKFRMIMMDILKILLPFAMGINLGLISIKGLLASSVTIQEIGMGVYYGLASVNSMVFYGVQIFTVVMLIILMLSSYGKSEPKEFIKEALALIVGTSFFYFIYKFVTAVFLTW